MAASDGDSYRRICGEFVARFGQTDDPVVADRIVKTCSLAPNSVTDFGLVERLAERAITGTEQHPYYRFFIEAKGLAEYRAGHFEQASEWIQRYTPVADGKVWDAIAFATLAMSQYRLSHVDQARQSLSCAHNIVAKRPEDWRSGGLWFDWLHSEMLVHEAEEMLNNKERPKSAMNF